MLEQQFSINVLTPIFLFGYHNGDRKSGKEELLELRIPSLKGVMRYWWRSAYSEENLDILKTEESKLFGCQNYKSPFSMKIVEKHTKQGTYNILPYKSVHTKRRNATLKALMPDTRFQLLIRTKNQDIGHKAQSILKLSFMLGGLGRRSRRGFGSLQIVENTWDDSDSFLSQLTKFLNDVRPGYFEKSENTIENIFLKKGLFKYPVIKKVCIGSPEKDFNPLLIRIDKATHENADKSLGGFRPRMASPVIARIQKIGDLFYPVVTELYDHREISNVIPKEKFIRQVIQNEGW